MDHDPIDDLYGVPLEDFVAERDALAKRLRAAGDRERADAVKKLPKPTRAAWAVNRLVRDRPDEVRGLIDAGDALSGAQEQLLEGADAGVLREAAAAARRLVDALADEAPAAGAAREKVRSTLHAATVDEAVRGEVAAGRLAKERSAAGFGGLEGLTAAPRTATGTKEKGRPKGRGSAKPASAAKARAKREPRGPSPAEVRRRRDALRRAKEAEAAAEGAVAGARRALAQVEATVEARRRDLAAAEAALSEARARRERAESPAA